MFRSWFRGLIVAFAILCGVSPAFAQTTPERSAELKRHGDELLHASDFKGAVGAYDEAYRLDPNPAILYNRSRALEGLGEWAEALGALEQFAREASPDLKARVPKLDALMSEQRAHVSLLAVTSPITGATIVVREKDVGTIPLTAPLRTNAGPATLEVRAPGYQTFRVSIDLPGGSLTTIDAPLLKVGETRPLPTTPQPAPGSGRRIVSIVLASIAVAAAGVGGVLLVVRESDASNLNKACPNGVCPTARTKELTSTRDRALMEGPLAAGLFIGAAALVGVAVLVWPWSKKAAPSSAQLALRGAMISLEGSF